MSCTKLTSDYGKDALAYFFLSHRLKQTCSKCWAVMLLEWVLFMKLLLPDIVIWGQFCSFHQNPILSYPAVSFNHKNPPMVGNSTTRPPSWRKLWLKDTAAYRYPREKNQIENHCMSTVLFQSGKDHAITVLNFEFNFNLNLSSLISLGLQVPDRFGLDSKPWKTVQWYQLDLFYTVCIATYLKKGM